MKRWMMLGVVAMMSLAPAAWAEGEAAATTTLTGHQAVDLLLSGSDGFSISVPNGEFEPIAAAIERDAKAQPQDARLALGMALVEQSRRNYKAARDEAERATKLDPKNAEAFYWLGNTVFSGIGEAGMLDKASLASKGRRAYEKAIELDPDHFAARYAMAQFYAGAPGIAGGSDKKARAEADALLKIEGGAFYGQMVIGQLAAKDEKWDEMTSAYEAAHGAAGSDAQRAWALRSSAWSLLDAKKDPEAALAVIERYVSVAEAGDVTARYFRGRALQDLGRYAEAAVEYRAAVEARPEAINSGYGLAECLEKSGDEAGALSAYETFVERHPDDKRAGDAKKAIKRLKKKASA